MYHLLGDIKGESSYDVPVSIGIILDDILWKAAFQKFNFLKCVYRLGTKALFQILIQNLPKFRQTSISHYCNSILMSFSKTA